MPLSHCTLLNSLLVMKKSVMAKPFRFQCARIAISLYKDSRPRHIAVARTGVFLCLFSWFYFFRDFVWNIAFKVTSVTILAFQSDLIDRFPPRGLNCLQPYIIDRYLYKYPNQQGVVSFAHSLLLLHMLEFLPI